MNWRTIRLCRDGIGFVWHGDAVMYVFPWARLTGKAWISFGLDGTFNSLQEIDALWDAYFDAIVRDFDDE